MLDFYDRFIPSIVWFLVSFLALSIYTSNPQLTVTSDHTQCGNVSYADNLLHSSLGAHTLQSAMFCPTWL